jgi:AbiU2
MAKPKNPCDMLERIGNELKLLWTLLNAYQELFLVEQDKRADLLAQTAPGFFAVMQVALIESILMRIFRLMDEASMGGSANCSFEALRKLIAKQPPSQRKNANEFRLRLRLRQLRKDWGVAGGLYAGLKKIRNKVLAHNDYTHHARRGKGQLWMALTTKEFDLAHQLAQRLWDLYRQGNLALCSSKNAPLEPIHSTIDGRPEQLLIHLCSSLFWDQLHRNHLDNHHKYAGCESRFEFDHMGECRIRPVFIDERVRTR